MLTDLASPLIPTAEWVFVVRGFRGIRSNYRQGVMTQTTGSLTLAEARQIIASGEQKAEELGVPYNLAVVDAGGNLIAHVRMDGAWLGSIDISIHKAWTARAFDMATDKLAKMAQSGKPLFGINSTNHEKVVIFAGGMPVKRGASVVGAVGASGGTIEQDQKVVEAAVQGLKADRHMRRDLASGE